MELQIGPYKLIQRTKYSKIRVIDENLQMDLNDISLYEKITNDYIAQTEAPEKYFNFSDGILYDFSDRMKNFNFIFIPDEIKIIEESVFKNCKASYIYLPNTIVFIKSAAFSESLLKEVSLPTSIYKLDSSIFANCKNLTKINIPDNITNIPACFVEGCDNLLEINFPDTVKTIGSNAFSGCKKIEKFIIPRDFRMFGNHPFAGSSIKVLQFNYDLPDAYDAINTYNGFLVDSVIEKIEISKNVKHIDPKFFTYSRGSIKEIEYLGTKKEFSEFKRENKLFFKSLEAVLPINLDTLTLGTITVKTLDNIDTLIQKHKIKNTLNKIFTFER